MKFIGEIPESDIERIAEALEEISFHKFNLNVKGTFLLDSPKGYALCAGFSEIPVELSEMNRKITSLLSRLGVRTDQKKFIAHITLARLKRSNSTRLETYLNEFQEIQSSSFSINEFHLFLSELHPNGAVHSILRSYPAS